MVKDAELHAEEDAKAKALVDARNQAETMINSIKKTLEEAGDKVEASEKENIEKAIAEVESVVEQDDVELINSKVEELMQASHKLAEMMYADGAEGASAAEAAPQDDNVVDAEFEEVKDEPASDDKKDA